MPTYALEKITAAVLAIVGFVILAAILTSLKVGGGFFYAGCEDSPSASEGGRGTSAAGIEGERCSGEVVGDTNVTIHKCGTGIKTVEAIANPRCTIYKNFENCAYVYENVTKDELSLPVCLWVNPPVVPSKSNCLMNAQLSCEDFSQKTFPKCQDVPGCKPVSAVKRTVERLKPEKLGIIN